MNYGRWETGDEKGRGGQGVTYLAEDNTRFAPILDSLARTVPAINGIGNFEAKQAQARALAEGVRRYLSEIQEEGIAALKVLHENIRTDSKALARFRQEIEVLTKNPHDNIIKIIDSDPSKGWFATTFFPLGTLADNSTRFQSNSLAALQALRPLVDAVASLHRMKVIHRDIKPANIFLSEKAGLVLGDFGLVFFADEARSRISEKYENVGSRDWMPPWAYGKRVDELNPAFDVFSLGKVLWAMISGKTLLPLWYHRRPEYDLGRMSKDPHTPLINALLDGCLKENEEDIGYPDAVALLNQIDQLLEIMRRNGELLRLNIPRVCRVCGYGEYELIADDTSTPNASEDVGFRLVGRLKWRVFCCRRCGNVQMFQMHRNPEAWGMGGGETEKSLYR